MNLFKYLKNLIHKPASQFVSAGKHTINIPADMAWCFADGNYYEKNVNYWFEKSVQSKKQPIIYDIGANYGYYSIKFSHEAKHIYSFEPVSHTYQVLKKNVEQNLIKNITPFQVGVSDSEQYLKINLYNSSGNNSIFNRTIPDGHPLRVIGTEQIKLVQLDNFHFQNNLFPPDLIKIDVEGAELGVLLGARQILEKYHPILLIEYSPETSNDAGYARESLLQLLDAYQYLVFGLDEDEKELKLIPRASFGEKTISNILAIYPEKEADFKANLESTLNLNE